MALAAGAALMLTFAVFVDTTTTTSAAQNDQANVNLSSIAILRFAVGVLNPDGTVAEASTDAPLPLRFDNGSQLIPGGSASTELLVFNNSERLTNLVSLAVETIGDGSVDIDGTTHPNITKFLRFTVSDEDGNTLLDRVAVDDATLALPTLAARERAELEPGDRFTAGADGSAMTLRIRIDYVDSPETINYVTGLSALALVLQATSAPA
jgi:hypothetical protein